MIALAGLCGALLRWALATVFDLFHNLFVDSTWALSLGNTFSSSVLQPGFGSGVLMANVAGVFLLALASREDYSRNGALSLFAIGFCGSLTTWSAFVLEGASNFHSRGSSTVKAAFDQIGTTGAVRSEVAFAFELDNSALSHFLVYLLLHIVLSYLAWSYGSKQFGLGLRLGGEVHAVQENQGGFVQWLATLNASQANRYLVVLATTALIHAVLARSTYVLVFVLFATASTLIRVRLISHPNPKWARMRTLAVNSFAAFLAGFIYVKTLGLSEVHLPEPLARYHINPQVALVAGLGCLSTYSTVVSQTFALARKDKPKAALFATLSLVCGLLAVAGGIQTAWL